MFFVLTTLVTPEEEQRFAHVYKQGYDTSCGIAVTAALLNNYWNIPATEPDLYQDMILDRLSDEAQTYTISFLDITRYAAERGVAARSYKMNWAELNDSLGKGYAPVVINYDKPKPHFALLLNIQNNFAFVADPAKGFEIVDKAAFIQSYSGNALLTASRSEKKNAAYIARITEEEERRLNALEALARRRR